MEIFLKLLWHGFLGFCVGTTLCHYYHFFKLNTPIKKHFSRVPKDYKVDKFLFLDKPYVDYSKYLIPEKPELPTDKFKLYHLGEFVCEIERKDMEKIEGIYDLEEIKLILNTK